MTQQEALERMKPSLTEVIQAWIDKTAENDDDTWGGLDCYIGNNTALCMSAAAMAVLASIVDVHNYLREDGHEV